jgi:PAS domain S-box-containing protein
MVKKSYRSAENIYRILPELFLAFFSILFVAMLYFEAINQPMVVERNQFFITIVIIAAGIILALIYLFKSRQTRHLKELYEKEREQKALLRHYDYLKLHANDPIFLIEPDGRIVEANIRAQQNYGYTEEEMSKLNVSDIRAPGTREDIKEQLGKISGSDGYVFETLHIRKDGTVFPVEVSSRYIDIDGTKYYHSVARDITDKKLAEEQMITARNIAEESSRLKSAILMNMSHELRTPLNGIIGFSQLLHRKLKGTPDEVMIGHIIKSGDRLLSTLTNILELAKLESEETPVNILPQSIKGIIHELTIKYAPLASKKNLYFTNSVNQDYPVRADYLMLMQSLGHILDNAIKFTCNGGISISADQQESGDILFTRIKVTDTGIGIPENEIENIFREFRQLSHGYKREFEGSGIGLSLVKKMLILMNGKIDVDSEPDKGATFTISLPSGSLTVKDKATADDTVRKAEPVPGHGTAIPYRTILVVEDNNTNAELIEAYLWKEVNIDIASDGITALEMAKRNKYDLVLMDINLGPGIDGLETTQRMRNINGYEEIPVIALTGYTMESDREKILKHGCDDILSKPFSQTQLKSVMAKISFNREM